MNGRSLAPAELDAIAAARFTAIVHAPYLATVLTAMTFVRQPGLDTVAVDSRVRVYVDPVVLERWTTVELAGVLLHEANHVIRGHHHRQSTSGVSASLYNVASDLEINDDLLRAGIGLPAGSLQPSMFGLPEHKLAEWYASKLNDQVEHERHPRCGSGAGGVVGEFELGNDVAIPGLEPGTVDLIRDAVAREIASRTTGIPGGLERWAHARLRSKVPWPQILTAAVRRSLPRGVGHQRHTWSRPRRHNPTIAILPSLRDMPVHIAVVVDSSASMSPNHLDQAVSDIAVLRAIAGVGRLTIVSCDTAAVQISVPRVGATVALIGGGGTSLEAGLVHVADLRHRADLVVVITDGLTDWPTAAPLRLAHVVALIPDGGRPGPAWMTTVTRPLAASPN
jgi:predicted metal-dependent peptidase